MTRPARVAQHAGLIAAAIVAIAPFFWLVALSIQQPATTNAPALAWPPTLENYVTIWREIPLARYLANSMLVATCVAVAQAATALLSGYVFARLNFPGRDAIFVVFLGTLLIPNEVTLLPSFLLMQALGWTNQPQALIVPFLASPIAIFLVRQYFLKIPEELTDAARIDGCSHWQLFLRVFVPLGLPVAGIVSIFSFLWAWKSFLWPLVMLQTPENYTLPVGLATLQSELGTNWPLLMAATVISTLPALAIYFAVLRGEVTLEFGF